jgi:hypothetical protein
MMKRWFVSNASKTSVMPAEGEIDMTKVMVMQTTILRLRS